MYAYFGGVAYYADTTDPPPSTFTATDSFFIENEARDSGGVADISASLFLALNSMFLENSAGSTAGVASVTYSSEFSARNSMFVENSAGSTAGVATVLGASTFSAWNSSFINNRASESDVIEMSESSVLELFNGSFTNRENVAAVRHRGGDATIYMALMRDLNLSTPVFDMNGGELFLYLTNDDGSPDNDLARIANGRSTVNVAHWTYPCGAGRISVDGMEHSETIRDVFGKSIDYNVSVFNLNPFPETCIRRIRHAILSELALAVMMTP